MTQHERGEHGGEKRKRRTFTEFVKEKKLALSLGAIAASSVATVANTPFNELIDDVAETAPWVAGGLAASEALFIGGFAMMAASVGEKIGNPLTIKERIPAIAEKAHGSKLFWTGFWVNTTGAVGDFAVLAVGITAKLPVESYPMLAIPLLDLGLTYFVRNAVISGIEENRQQNI